MTNGHQTILHWRLHAACERQTRFVQKKPLVGLHAFSRGGGMVRASEETSAWSLWMGVVPNPTAMLDITIVTAGHPYHLSRFAVRILSIKTQKKHLLHSRP
jgi:hypothetical protein